MFVVSLKKSLPCVLAATLAVGVLAGVDAPAFSGTPLAPAVASAAISKSYDFSQNIGSWAYAGNYSYSGQASAAYDPAFGGSLKLSVDFSKDKDATWSEVKLSDTGITASTPLEVANCNVLEFDLYYDPAKIGGDSMFKVKVFGKDVKGDEVINDLADDIGMSRAKAVDGSTLKRVHVKVPLMDGFTGKLSHLEVSIVSYLSGYQGDVYINNLKL
ncbi:MAG: hypothetical protein SOZ01_02055 [Selenomonadaceae bacterium]|nr:hypothetical protein [Selenomonadaceae bacterium]MDY3915516.1 hypothetical protein [Selenomonadaceae bacterium]